MPRLKNAVLVALLSLALSATAPAADTAGTNKPVAISDDVVRIGVLADMSGPYSDLGGKGSLVATQMAVDDFGGKVLGKRIEVVSADHQNKADVASAKAREWFDQGGVDMITDLTNSSVGIAVGKVAVEKKRVLMATTTASSRMTNEDCTPFTVHYVYDTYSLANGVARALVKQGGDSWYFITADYAFGHTLEQDAANVVTALGGKVLGRARHPLNVSDTSSFLLQAQQSKAKVIGLANAGSDLVNTLKTANEFGIGKGQTFAVLLTFITDIHALGLQASQGLILVDGWYWDQNEETRKFGRRFFEKVKKMPTMAQAGTYSAVQLYLKAIELARTDEAVAVMAQLRKMRVNDMFAKNGYIREDGRMVHDMYLMKVKKPAESRYPWDYYHVQATIPGEETVVPLAQSRCPLVRK